MEVNDFEISLIDVTICSLTCLKNGINSVDHFFVNRI